MIMFAAAGWTAYVWGTRVWNIARSDETAQFKLVHYVIAAISLGFAGALTWGGVRLRSKA